MNSQRLNVFNQIHKGLRALMFDTAIIAQQTDFGDNAQAAPVLAQMELLLSLFDAHAYHEDRCILNVAEPHNPELIKEFEREHETDLMLSAELKDQIKAYKAAFTIENKIAIGYQLLYSLNNFIAFNLNHMNKEEQELNEVLWQGYSDEEILQMEHEIQSLIDPNKRLVYFKWMIKGINNIEMVQWLISVKNGAPEFVLNELLQECRNNLPPERWNLLQSLLSEGSLTQEMLLI